MKGMRTRRVTCTSTDGIVGEAPQSGPGGDGAGAGEERVRPSAGLRHRFDPDDPACAAAVLDDDVLAEFRASGSASSRAVRSTPPPGGKGTISRIGRLGMEDCARPGAGVSRIPADSKRRVGAWGRLARASHQ